MPWLFDDTHLHPFIHGSQLETHTLSKSWRPQLLHFLFVVEQFLFFCGFFSFVFHESTAGTSILTPFLAETLFYKYCLEVKVKTSLPFPTMKTIQSAFFPLLCKTSKAHSQGLLNANAPWPPLIFLGSLGLSNNSCFSVSFISSLFCWPRNSIILFFGNHWETIGCFAHHMGSLVLGCWAFIIPDRNGQHLILLTYWHREAWGLCMQIIMTPDI